MNLRDILQTKQQYVADYVENSGAEIKVVQHEKATTTCFEKADLLGWESERVVKVVFFHKENSFYGFIFPELGTRENLKYISKKIISNVLGISRNQAKKFENSYCPKGMEKGTCTPFVLENSFESGLEKLFIHDIPKLDKEVVDISIGGKGERYHKISLHLHYEVIYKILDYKFRGKIEKFTLENFK